MKIPTQEGEYPCKCTELSLKRKGELLVHVFSYSSDNAALQLLDRSMYHVFIVRKNINYCLNLI